MMSQPHFGQTPSFPPVEAIAVRFPVVVALLIAAFLILGAGFAPIGALHNAAHDVRQSFAFPCH